MPNNWLKSILCQYSEMISKREIQTGHRDIQITSRKWFLWSFICLKEGLSHYFYCYLKVSYKILKTIRNQRTATATATEK